MARNARKAASRAWHSAGGIGAASRTYTGAASPNLIGRDPEDPVRRPRRRPVRRDSRPGSVHPGFVGEGIANPAGSQAGDDPRVVEDRWIADVEPALKSSRVHGPPEPPSDVEAGARGVERGRRDERRQRSSILAVAVLLVVERLLPEAPLPGVRVLVHLLEGEESVADLHEPRLEVVEPARDAIRVWAVEVHEELDRDGAHPVGVVRTSPWPGGWLGLRPRRSGEARRGHAGSGVAGHRAAAAAPATATTSVRM